MDEKEQMVYDNHPSDARMTEESVCPTLRSRIGTGGGNVPLVRETTTLGPGNFPVLHNGQLWDGLENDMAPCLRARGGTGGNSVPMFMDESKTQLRRKEGEEMAYDMAESSLEEKKEKTTRYVVRRITPTECERLQGFPTKGEVGPDGKVLERDYTDIPWPKSDHSPDSHRYKALGNSFSVSVIRLIGQQIIDALSNPITEDKSEKVAYQKGLFDD